LIVGAKVHKIGKDAQLTGLPTLQTKTRALEKNK